MTALLSFPLFKSNTSQSFGLLGIFDLFCIGNKTSGTSFLEEISGQRGLFCVAIDR